MPLREDLLDSGIVMRKFTLEKHLLPGAFGVEGAAIDENSCRRLAVGVGQNVQLFFGTVILSGKTEELKEESTAPGVERIGSQLVAKRLDCRPKLPRPVQFEWGHEG